MLLPGSLGIAVLSSVHVRGSKSLWDGWHGCREVGTVNCTGLVSRRGRVAAVARIVCWLLCYPPLFQLPVISPFRYDAPYDDGHGDEYDITNNNAGESSCADNVRGVLEVADGTVEVVGRALPPDRHVS